MDQHDEKLSRRAARVSGRLRSLDRRIAACEQKLATYRRQKDAATIELARIQSPARAAFGKPTRKNRKLYRISEAVKEQLHDPAVYARRCEGLTSQELYAAACADVGALNAVTFRSYMRKMRKAGLIEKTPDERWISCAMR